MATPLEFYKEEKLKKVKETEIGKIPKEWEVVRLEDLCERIKAGGTPSTSKREFWNGDIPFVKIEDITLAGKYLTNTKEKISKLGLENSSAWIVPENSLLLAMYGSLGEVTINKIPAATNQAILGIISSKCDVEFLYYWFLYFKPNWKRYAKPTTQANLTAEIVRNSKIPLPPLHEQRKIAHVLTTIDKAIEEVDKAIKKAERIKKGLMQELLTKGIGHKEFKDTEIGRIPKEWKVVRLGELTKVTVGYVGKINEYYTTENDGVPLLSTTNISENGIRLDEIKYVSRGFHSKNKKSQVFSGDIIIARHGMSGTATTIPEFLKEAQCLNVVIVRSSREFYSKFVEYLFNFEPTRRRLLGWKSGSVQGVVNTKVLEKFKILLPPLPEQQKIAEILSKWDRVIELKKAKKEKLERMKKKVMELLLTGKVRIK